MTQDSVSKKESTLKQDILKIVLDKLLIALLLIVAGYFSTTLVEKFKADISFSGQLNKIRAEKIGETWEQVYKYEGVISTLHASMSPDNPDQQFIPTFSARVLVKGRNQAEMERELEKQTKIGTDSAKKRIEDLKVLSSTLYEQVIESANKNRFWLGESHFKQIVDYARLLALHNWRETIELDKGEGSGSENQAKVKELKDQLTKAAIGVREIRMELLDKPRG